MKYTFEEIMEEYYYLPCEDRLRLLNEALDYMQQYNGRSKYECIAMAMRYSREYDDNGNQVWVKE